MSLLDFGLEYNQIREDDPLPGCGQNCPIKITKRCEHCGYATAYMRIRESCKSLHEREPEYRFDCFYGGYRPCLCKEEEE